MNQFTAKLDSVHLSLRTASTLARADAALATLERDKPGHGAAKLARRVKAACPDVSQAQCRRAADLILAKRLERPLSRALGRTPKSVPAIANRLTTHKTAKVVRAFGQTCFRHSRAWEGDIRVEFGAPAASQSTATGWIDYKSHGRRVGIVSETVRLSVPADWGMRVRPLDYTAGLLLLDAEQLPTDGAVSIYRAVWCRQGRGVSLITEHGFLARHDPTGLTYHSADPDPRKALAGLKRQVAIQATPPAVRADRARTAAEARQARRGAQLDRLRDRLARYDFAEIAHVMVSRADSLRAGNCAPGTHAFADRYFGPDRDAATVGEMAAAIGRTDLAAMAGHDLTLARQVAAAVLVAVRKDRTAARLVEV